jgi:hypothetical protein
MSASSQGRSKYIWDDWNSDEECGRDAEINIKLSNSAKSVQSSSLILDYSTVMSSGKIATVAPSREFLAGSISSQVSLCTHLLHQMREYFVCKSAQPTEFISDSLHCIR